MCDIRRAHFVWFQYTLFCPCGGQFDTIRPETALNRPGSQGNAEDESAVLRGCTYIRDRIRSELRGRKDAAVLGPAPLPVVRVSNRYRYRVTLHCRFDKEIRTLVSGLLIQCNTAKEYKGVSVFADYNPME